MTDLTVVTFDWVPEMPRGLVRDLRIRWALEEAGLPYRVGTVPFEDRTAEHLAHQPFAQVPFLTHGETSVFESGAILIYLGGLSKTLMPQDAAGRAAVTQWMFAALNSVEMAGLPWGLFNFMNFPTDTPERAFIDKFLAARLGHMETVLTGRTWLTGSFTVADIAMADVLRLVDKFEGLADYPACKAYLDRATDRPAFQKAYADQLAHFAEADRKRAKNA